ncbi:hypothetical protein ACFFRR_003848 [Megaselia abdita]
MEVNLTEDELIAKHFWKHLWNNIEEPCDKALPIDEPDLPIWFDPVKYQKGREFFFKNKWSIVESNMIGLICLLLDSKGLSILSMTGKSSTVKDAGKRYFSTAVHMLSWYYVDLTPKSQSRLSLKNVRKAHYNASMKAIEQKLGPITQMMMSLTAFGFMAFPLMYPNTMGLIEATPENIEGFVHFWAVIGYILGIKDEFNLCLLPVEPVRIVCKHFLRMFLIPQLQIETPHFKEMVGIMLEGSKKMIPLRETRVFITLTKIYCQVPGYNKFISREDTPNHRMIFTQSELDSAHEIIRKHNPQFPPTTKIPIIKINEKAQSSENRDDKTGRDYNHIKESLQIEDISKIDIQYKPFNGDKAMNFGSELFDEEKIAIKLNVRLSFLIKKIYRSSSFCRWILDIILEKDMQRRFGNRYIGRYNT